MPRDESNNGRCLTEIESIYVNGTPLEVERLRQVSPGDCTIASFMNTWSLLSLIDPAIALAIPTDHMGKLPSAGIAGFRRTLVEQFEARREILRMEEPLTNQETVDLFRLMYNGNISQDDIVTTQPQSQSTQRQLAALDALEKLDNPIYGDIPKVMVLGMAGHCTTLVRVPGDNYIHIDPLAESYTFLDTQSAMELLSEVNNNTSNFLLLLQKPNSNHSSVNSIRS